MAAASQYSCNESSLLNCFSLIYKLSYSVIDKEWRGGKSTETTSNCKLCGGLLCQSSFSSCRQFLKYRTRQNKIGREIKGDEVAPGRILWGKKSGMSGYK
jgi:hypothetical protein